MSDNLSFDTSQDLVVFGTFDGLKAVAFNRLYGLHLDPALLDIRQKAELLSALESEKDQIIFLKNLYVAGSDPTRVLGILYQHTDNSGRKGLFGVGHIIDDQASYSATLKVVSAFAKQFLENRQEKWSQLQESFVAYTPPAGYEDQQFLTGQSMQEVILPVSAVKGMWEGLFTLCASLDAMLQTDIYLVSTSNSAAISPQELMLMIAHAVQQDKEQLWQRLQDQETLKMQIEEQDRVHASLQSKVAELEKREAETLERIDDQLRELFDAESANVHYLSSIINELSESSPPSVDPMLDMAPKRSFKTPHNADGSLNETRLDNVRYQSQTRNREAASDYAPDSYRGSRTHLERYKRRDRWVKISRAIGIFLVVLAIIIFVYQMLSGSGPVPDMTNEGHSLSNNY